MSELTVRAIVFQRMLDYLEQIGLDAGAVAARVKISPHRIRELDPEEALPALQYARFYRAAVREMQTLRQPIPWAAGLGSDAFELMCRCVITTQTLSEALAVAERFDRLLYPLLGYNIHLQDDGESPSVKLSYHIRVEEGDCVLAPPHWERSASLPTVARASGLEVWCSFCGWLTGKPLDVAEVRVAAPYINQAYYDSLAQVFRCPIIFDADETCMVFPRKTLARRLVQTPASLADFLDSSLYHLIAVGHGATSTSAAIKSLVSIEMANGLPSFAWVANSLHMSESSLRRRLQKENTSYQALKDEIRCEVAIDRLLNHDARVAELADYLGFTEASSFVRSFKNWTGHTPRSYRERVRSLGSA